VKIGHSTLAVLGALLIAPTMSFAMPIDIGGVGNGLSNGPIVRIDCRLQCARVVGRKCLSVKRVCDGSTTSSRHLRDPQRQLFR